MNNRLASRAKVLHDAQQESAVHDKEERSGGVNSTGASTRKLDQTHSYPTNLRLFNGAAAVPRQMTMTGEVAKK